MLQGYDGCKNLDVLFCLVEGLPEFKKESAAGRQLVNRRQHGCHSSDFLKIFYSDSYNANNV
jgi:hypothetical protein